MIINMYHSIHRIIRLEGFPKNCLGRFMRCAFNFVHTTFNLFNLHRNSGYGDFHVCYTFCQLFNIKG